MDYAEVQLDILEVGKEDSSHQPQSHHHRITTPELKIDLYLDMDYMTINLLRYKLDCLGFLVRSVKAVFFNDNPMIRRSFQVHVEDWLFCLWRFSFWWSSLGKSRRSEPKCTPKLHVIGVASKWPVVKRRQK